MLFDKLKKIIKKYEKKGDKKVVKKEVVKKTESDGKLDPKKTVGKKPAENKRSALAYSVIKRPVVTEKGGLLAQQNKYLFKVHTSAGKTEIQKAVGALYNVTVKSVNVITVPRKKRVRGRVEGYKSGFKKAVVTLKEGDKIDFI